MESNTAICERLIGKITDAHGECLRRMRKRSGLAVGIASDEVRCFGLQAEKRTRVIRAGAHLVVPDYSQLNALMALLRIR